MRRGKKAPGVEQRPDPKVLYVCEGMTLDEIAAKYRGVRGYSKSSLARRSASEMWKERRRQHLRRVDRAIDEKASEGASVAPTSSEVAIDNAAVEAGERLGPKLIQARELVLDGALLALSDVRKVLLSDKIRILSEDGGTALEMKTTLRDKDLAMRMYAVAAAAVRGFSQERRPEGDVELRKLQREKLAAEIEQLRQSIKRSQGSTPEVMDDLLQDDDASIEQLYERITSLLAASPKTPDA